MAINLSNKNITICLFKQKRFLSDIKPGKLQQFKSWAIYFQLPAHLSHRNNDTTINPFFLPPSWHHFTAFALGVSTAPLLPQSENKLLIFMDYYGAREGR